MPPLETRTDSPGETHIQRNPVSAWQLEMKDPILLSQESFFRVPVASQEQGLSIERREVLQGRATFPTVPQISQSISEEPVFPALPRLSSRGSTHTMVARGTALWESLVGKPRGKAPRESLEGKPQIP